MRTLRCLRNDEKSPIRIPPTPIPSSNTAATLRESHFPWRGQAGYGRRGHIRERRLDRERRGLRRELHRTTPLNREDKAVAELGDRLDITGIRGRIAQDAAQFLDCGVQAVFEIYKCVRGPELLTELFAGDNLAGAFDQQR